MSFLQTKGGQEERPSRSGIKSNSDTDSGLTKSADAVTTPPPIAPTVETVLVTAEPTGVLMACLISLAVLMITSVAMAILSETCCLAAVRCQK